VGSTVKITSSRYFPVVLSFICWHQTVPCNILKAITNATFYKAFLMQKVYMILEDNAIKVKNFCQAHFCVKLFQYRKLPFDI